MHQRDRGTYVQTDTRRQQRPRLRIASRGKNYPLHPALRETKCCVAYQQADDTFADYTWMRACISLTLRLVYVAVWSEWRYKLAYLRLKVSAQRFVIQLDHCTERSSGWLTSRNYVRVATCWRSKIWGKLGRMQAFCWFLSFLPRGAMRKRGLCCRPVSVCQSVCLTCWSIVYTRLKILSNFFLGPVAPSFWIFDLKRRHQIPRRTLLAGAHSTRGWENVAIFDWNLGNGIRDTR